jgi:glycosyltransferase involved in cell wall biosynthesis
MRSESLHQSLSLTSAMAEIGALIGQPAQALEGPLERAHIPSPPVRVLFLNHTAEPGGAEIAMLNLVRHLDRRKIAPVVVFGTDGPVVEQMRRHAEVHVLSLPASVGGAKKDAMGAGSVLQFRAMLAAIAYIWRLARFIRQIRPDFIHTNSLKAHFLGGFAARLSATPVVWHVRNSVDSDYLPSSIVRVIFRGLAKLVPRFIIACSGATLRTVVPHGPETDGCEASGSKITERCAVVHDGTPPPSVDVADSRPYDGAFRIALIGRISPWKGQDVFIRAAAEVRQSFPRAQFYIVGSALFGEENYERQVRDLTGSYGIPDLVTFTGFRSDVLSVIADMDLIVHASTIGEPFGQVIIEGMAAGKPVIATNGGGVPEIVEDGKTGILVPMRDASAMAEAMKLLIADRGLAADMGALGRKRVLDRFTIQHTARKIEAIYLSMAAPQPSTT